jgi:hypothetical protein
MCPFWNNERLDLTLKYASNTRYQPRRAGIDFSQRKRQVNRLDGELAGCVGGLFDGYVFLWSDYPLFDRHHVLTSLLS